MRRYRGDEWIADAVWDPAGHEWVVHVSVLGDEEVAQVRVDGATGAVLEAWTGPQVLWGMARGGSGSFGGTAFASGWLWVALGVVFLAGLADLRRPLSLRNLDLVVLLSFTASIWFFDRGRVFASVSLLYPPLAYLLGRAAWTGLRGRRTAAPRFALPVAVLAAATLFLVGARVGVAISGSRVIDVGYATVAGGRLILDGRAPWGHMPADVAAGDTYGPGAYLGAVPAVAVLGVGRSSSLPAARATALVWDVLAVAGLWVLGLRLGGMRLAWTLAFAWAAYPFTLYSLASATNDAMVGALLAWGLALFHVPAARGALLALAGWTKLAALPLAPLWLRAAPRRWAIAAFAGTTVAVLCVLLLDPHPLHEARVAWERTVRFQEGRRSPFSIWDWSRYRVGVPDLRLAERVLGFAVLAWAASLAVWPRRRLDVVEVAALSAAVLLAILIVLPHLTTLYLPWIVPPLAACLLVPRDTREPAPA